MKRENGEGTWSKRNIKGTTYYRHRKYYGNTRKEFYGRTKKDVLEKVKEYEMGRKKPQAFISDKFTDSMYDWLINTRINEVGDNTYTTNLKEFNSYILKSHLKLYDVSQIDYRDIQALVNDMAKKYARSTIKRVYNLIHTFCKHLKEIGAIEVDPCAGVSIPTENIVRKKKKVISFFDTEQLKIFCKEVERKNEPGSMINGQEGTNVYATSAWLLVLVAYTGLRYGELAALQWKDIDFDEKLMSVTKAVATKTNPESMESETVLKEPKYNSKRIIPLSDKAIEALEILKNDQRNPSKNNFITTMRSSSLNKSLKQINKRAGLPVENFSLHSLRHSFGSVLLEQGVNLKVISELLGHKDISTTANIYIGVTEKVKVESISVLNEI